MSSIRLVLQIYANMDMNGGENGGLENMINWEGKDKGLGCAYSICGVGRQVCKDDGKFADSKNTDSKRWKVVDACILSDVWKGWN